MDDATFGAKFDKWSTLGDGMPKDLTLRRSEVVNMLEAAYSACMIFIVTCISVSDYLQGLQRGNPPPR